MGKKAKPEIEPRELLNYCLTVARGKSGIERCRQAADYFDYKNGRQVKDVLEASDLWPLLMQTIKEERRSETEVVPPEIHDLFQAVVKAPGKSLHECCGQICQQFGYDSYGGPYNALARYNLVESARQAIINRDQHAFAEKYGWDIAGMASIEAENKALITEIRHLRDFWATLELSIQRIVSTRPKISIPEPPKRRIKTDGLYAANVMVSDIHGGETYTPADTMGASAYNIDTMLERGDKLRDKVIQLVELKSYPVDILLVDLLGDYVEGADIYPGQRNYINPTSVLQQVFMVSDMIISLIGTWAKHFNQIYVRGVPGNHGRIYKKHFHKHDNWDNLVLELVARAFEPVEHVDVIYERAGGMAYQIPEMPKFNHLISHGDTIRGWAGVPYYGIQRAVQAWALMYGTVMDATKLAHFHTDAKLAQGPGVALVNGSWPGGSPYSTVELHATARPSQKLLLFHEDEGLIIEEPIYLAPPKKWTTDEHGIFR